MVTLRTQHGLAVVVLLAMMLTSNASMAQADNGPTANDSTGPRRSRFEVPNTLRSRVFGVPAAGWLQRIGGFSAPLVDSPTRGSDLELKEESEFETRAIEDSSVADTNAAHVDGTWREENGYVIINLNGQELRLAKSPGSTTSRSEGEARQPAPSAIVPAAFSTNSDAAALVQTSQPATGGTVSGRLMHRGRPVTECRVSLLPLRKSFGGYGIDERAERQSTATAADGRYHFSNVPSGAYKLFWLPKGERSWVRRIEYKPDVLVQTGEESRIKDIRTALRTLN